MELTEAKEKFIQTWGTLGSDWGVNRTMAQVHALLMVADGPMSAEDIMEQLQISRGNTNMNVRALIDWGLVHKELKPGDRKEYFVAQKDMWEVVRNIIIQRKRKELEPVIKALNEMGNVDGEGSDVDAFRDTVANLRLFSQKADATLESFIKADQNWLMSTFMKMIK